MRATTAAELPTERWALLIIRDPLVAPRRYPELKHGRPRIPTSIYSTSRAELHERPTAVAGSDLDYLQLAIGDMRPRLDGTHLDP